MGQYYNIIIREKGSKTIKAFDRHIDGEYTLAKLTEHSWWLNPMVNAISEKLYHKPSHIAWVGDYAEDSKLYKYAWPKNDKYEMLHKTFFNLDREYLVNHTKKLILDCWDYLENCIKLNDNSWVPHPLPLLVAIGNGRGGGDYRGLNEDKIGCWAWDLLEIVEWEDLKELENKGYQKFKIRFEDK